jgi:hypothetical protein
VGVGGVGGGVEGEGAVSVVVGVFGGVAAERAGETDVRHWDEERSEAGLPGTMVRSEDELMSRSPHSVGVSEVTVRGARGVVWPPRMSGWGRRTVEMSMRVLRSTWVKGKNCGQSYNRLNL